LACGRLTSRETGFPSFVSVHHEAAGNAKARMLAIAKGIDSGSFADEWCNQQPTAMALRGG
jgi:ketol-acid reductoisomerase